MEVKDVYLDQPTILNEATSWLILFQFLWYQKAIQQCMKRNLSEQSAPRLWNKLPNYTKLIASKEIFTVLRIHLFKWAYLHHINQCVYV